MNQILAKKNYVDIALTLFRLGFLEGGSFTPQPK